MNTTAMFHAGGTKPTVIALHCSGATGHMWRHLEAALGERSSLIAPDLIGCGCAQPWSGEHDFSLSDEAAPMLSIIDATESPVHLVGHSYGGVVALRVARERPNRIASLTLYEPSLLSALNTIGDEGRVVFAEVRAVAQQIVGANRTGAYVAAAQRFMNYWNGAGSWDAMSAEKQTALVRHLPKASLEYRALARERVPLQAFRRFNFPVLLLQGEHSPQFVKLIVRQLHRTMKFVSLHVVAGAGHMGPVTHVDAVNAAIVAQIARAASMIVENEGVLPIAKRLAA